MRRHLAALSLLSLAALHPPSAQAQLRVTGRYAVTQAEVARAIVRALGGGSSLATEQIHLLTDVSATQPSPVLDITSLSPLPQQASDRHQVAVRIVCRASAVCLPFYAIASLPSDVNLSGFTRINPAAASLQPTTLLKPTTSSKPMVILRSGAHATLILEDGSARLAVPVISLQNAVEGQSIRVASLDRKHIYTAHTITATLLRGSF